MSDRRLPDSLEHLYDRLRSRLADDWVVVQRDITVRSRQHPLQAGRRDPDRERAESDALRELVDPGDHVVIIGGGRGITTVVAARAAGPDGRVDVFEASPKWAARVRDAVRSNHAPAAVTIHEAVVGGVLTDQSKRLFGDADTEVVPAAEVPSGDIWNIDVEGAEAAILPEADLPERVICEVHPSVAETEPVYSALGSAAEVREKCIGDGPFLLVRGSGSTDEAEGGRCE
jgi:hypothetical protein